MKTKRIILEDRFSTLQKTMLYLFSILFIVRFTSIISALYNQSISEFLISLTLVVISVLLLIFPFAKKGFLIMSDELFLASFIGNRYFTKRIVKKKNCPIVSILEFKTGQKMWSSVANPHLKIENYIYQINLLNTKHTARNKIMFLEKKENAENAVAFLTEHLDLRNEIYSPNHY